MSWETVFRIATTLRKYGVVTGLQMFADRDGLGAHAHFTLHLEKLCGVEYLRSVIATVTLGAATNIEVAYA